MDSPRTGSEAGVHRPQEGHEKNSGCLWTWIWKQLHYFHLPLTEIGPVFQLWI